MFILKIIIVSTVLIFVSALGPAFGLAETLKAAIPVEPQNLDPHKTRDMWAAPFIFACYQRLTKFKEDSTEVQPDLAVTWRISDDGRLYTFVIKDGVTFSDGRKVNAETVRFSFGRALKLGQVGPTYFPTLESIEVLGPQTIRFRLSRPDPVFLLALSSSAGSIVSPGVTDHPPDYLERHTLGSGIYRLAEWTSGQAISLEVRTDQLVQPYIDSFITYFESEPGRALELLRSGGVHIAAGLGPSELAILQAETDYRIHSSLSFESDFMALNCRQPWLSQPEARQVLSMAVNYYGLMVHVHDGAARRMGGPLPLGMWGRRDNIKQYDYNPVSAGELMEKMGPPPRPLTLIYTRDQPWRTREALFLQENLQELGIRVEPMELSAEELNHRLKQGNYDMYLGLFRPPLASTDLDLRYWYHSILAGRGGNPAFFENQEVDELLRKAESTVDKRRRQSVYGQIQEIAVKEAPYIFLYQLERPVGLARTVENFRLHPGLPTVYPLTQIKLRPPPEKKP